MLGRPFDLKQSLTNNTIANRVSSVFGEPIDAVAASFFIKP